MPFDALLLRALEQRWQSTLVGMEFYSVMVDDDGSFWFTGRDAQNGQMRRLLMVLTPGQARMHFTQRTLSKTSRKKATPAFLERLLPFRVTSVTVPAFERWIRIGMTHLDDLEQMVSRTLIVELAGHLTNLIVLKDDDIILDAIKRVGSGRPGRSVWPGDRYTPPPAVANPCVTHNGNDLTPWAKTWMAEPQSDANWPQFCEDWERGQYHFYRLTPENSSQPAEIWIYPQHGYYPEVLSDPESALDALYTERERQRRNSADVQQLRRLWNQRLVHLQEKIADFAKQIAIDPEPWRQEADLWLGYQHQFQDSELPHSIVVPGLVDPSLPVTLTLEPGQTPWQRAEDLYRKAKKQEARRESYTQMIPQLEAELASLRSQIDILSGEEPSAEWVRQYLVQAQKTYGTPTQDNSEPYRRFAAKSGHAILVGRSRTENAHLTFRVARPDDLWFHVKQSPGSHVILSCGKTHPSLEDLLDAAELAVFYSQAARSSMVPVDYTRKKHVRKRPHGEPGQVLYREEKTLYITPDPERLRRLGAVREKLAERQNP